MPLHGFSFFFWSILTLRHDRTPSSYRNVNQWIVLHNRQPIMCSIETHCYLNQHCTCTSCLHTSSFEGSRITIIKWFLYTPYLVSYNNINCIIMIITKPTVLLLHYIILHGKYIYDKSYIYCLFSVVNMHWNWMANNFALL